MRRTAIRVAIAFTALIGAGSVPASSIAGTGRTDARTSEAPGIGAVPIVTTTLVRYELVNGRMQSTTLARTTSLGTSTAALDAQVAELAPPRSLAAGSGCAPTVHRGAIAQSPLPATYRQVIVYTWCWNIFRQITQATVAWRDSVLPGYCWFNVDQRSLQWNSSNTEWKTQNYARLGHYAGSCFLHVDSLDPRIYIRSNGSWNWAV